MTNHVTIFDLRLVEPGHNRNLGITSIITTYVFYSHKELIRFNNAGLDPDGEHQYGIDDMFIACVF